jgi:hypothetical protein
MLITVKKALLDAPFSSNGASADLSEAVGWLRQAYDEIAIRKMR